MRTCRGVLGWFGLVGGCATGVVMVWVGSAAAHVDVSADDPRAGATDVTVSFAVASEHDTEGMVSIQVVLPPGIASEDVSWVSGPAGWELTRSEVDGEDAYTVAGPETPPGEDVAYQVMVARLPTQATELAFRSLQTYGDEHVDRWIELPQPGVELQAPAPLLTVTAAASPTAAPAGATPTGASTPASAPATSGSQAALTSGDSGAVPWIITAGLVLVALAGGLLWWRRRSAAVRPDGQP